MTETTTRRQTVNFLGFLRSQLSGLQGIPTLCYELIQNADDVKDINGNPGASIITFDVCDDALYVENDGVFRDIDFTRMENVSWGNKREEAGTTGAFGIGFISVYQVTDSPEIFSAGRHWKFRPDAAEDQRIVEQKVETEYTRFRLPWAYDVSNVRAELRIPPIDKNQLDNFADQINQAIESAALFLKQVTVLEIKRAGKIIRHIETLKDGDCLLVADGNQTIEWQILQGRFDDSANRMRRIYGALIEEKRQPVVKIAVPEKLLENGLLYAFLPSETRTNLPFHINADFYPSQDRKRIPFEQSYQSEWNHLAVQCAAETLANHIDQLLEMFSPAEFWDFLDHIKKASDTSVLSPVFSKFWEVSKPEVRAQKTVFTTAGNYVLPPQAVYLDSDEQVEAGETFEDLGIDTVHPDLRGKRNLLIETGVRLLKITDIYDGLKKNGLDKRIELIKCPSNLQTETGWKIFWNALNNLWEKTSTLERPRGETLLRNCAIAFGSDNALWPTTELLKADQETERLYSKISVVNWYCDKSGSGPLPGSLVKEFGIREGIRILDQSQASLANLWKTGNFNPKLIYEWLEEFRNEIISHNELKRSIRALGIWPTADKSLKPLDQLYLTGDFQDPLKLAQLVDVEALGGRREFLEGVLGVGRLDFITYVRDWVPSVVKTQDLGQEYKFRLLEVLAENLGKLQGHIDLQASLSELSLVWCGGEIFLPATKVCFDSKIVKEVLGPQTKIAQAPREHADAIHALYEWLGVVPEPRPTDIINRIRSLVTESPHKESLQSIEKIFSYLANQWIFWNDGLRSQFSILQRIAWLPGTQSNHQWFEPGSVYAIYQSYLFESQGNFLKIDRPTQQKGNDLIRFLGIRSEPSTEQVVRHLISSSEKQNPITQEIYVFLTRNAFDPSIRLLKGRSCLYLKTSSGIDRYFRADQVFWEQHPFLDYRYRLIPEFGRFKDLFDQLGVKVKPDAQDAINVLLEIADEFGSSNIPLSDHEDVEDVVIRCWKLLSNSLEFGEIKTDAIQKALGNKKTIPDARHILEPPVHLFFEDRPGWGSKFELVKNSLTLRIEGAWLGMEAAGVQRLSKAVSTEMHECANPRESDSMKDYLIDRRTLIQRIMEAHRTKGIKDFELTKLDSLIFIEADHIEIVRVFSGFGRLEHAALESVDAIYLNGNLYFQSDNGQKPWKGISRELSFVLHPSGELNSLGMELKEIFSQPIEEASLALDEYGYPRIEIISPIIPEGPTVEPGEKNGDEAEPPSQNPPTDEGREKDKSRGGKPEETPVKKPKEGKPEKRKNSRLVSYVYPKDTKSTQTENSDLSGRRTEIGQLGVNRVIRYEENQGRNPTDMETIQVHHPGYDIRSVDETGKIRYIEVKSFSGIWDSQNPAQLTKTEFEAAREFGESFWLYIVEKVESDEFRIRIIRDPATKVDSYLFDHGWLGICE